MKIVHAPTDLGMRAVSLSEIEQLLGCESKVIVRAPGVHVSGMVHDIYSRNRFKFAIRLFLAIKESISADLVMLNAGSSLLDFGYFGLELKDLYLYRLFNKRVITTFQGCDVRMCEMCPVRRFVSDGIVCANVPKELSYNAFDRLKQRRLDKLSNVSEKLLGITPDLCRSDTRIQYMPHVKIVKQVGENKNKNNPTIKKIRIGHMPKHHKGTKYIEKIVSSLQSKYNEKFTYVPITGLPWVEALELMSSCDLLIDQMLMGWYGGISVEAAFLGLPSVCYVDMDLLQYVPEVMKKRLPVVAIEHRECLYDSLKELILHPEQLVLESKRCRENVEEFHDPIKIVKLILNQNRI